MATERSVPILGGVKTRTLLLLAVGCGLVILIAGSIKVFLIADDTAPAHLRVGQTAKVADMSVTVESVHPGDGQTLVDIAISGVDDEDGSATFFYGIGASKELRPVAPTTNAGTACAATARGSVTNCVLAFDTAVTEGVLRYERGGEKARWDLVGLPAG